jgi:RNA-directed DNA polymerase
MEIARQFLQVNNFQMAWMKVQENNGSAGVDGETIDRFARNQVVNIERLCASVADNTYQVSPCKQVIIPKRNGSQRELKIPTVRDRIVQQALLNVVSPLMEERFLPVSFGYRPNLSYLNAVEKVAYWRDRGFSWVLDGDIVKFFDNIEHQRLLYYVRSHIDCPGILGLIRSWISAGVLTPEGTIVPQKGVPQGAVISPWLANVYLHEFDRAIVDTDLQLVRYADDFLLLAQTQERIFHAKSETIAILSELGLTLHEDKSQIANFTRGFQFLGHGFLDNAIFPIDADATSLKSALNKVPEIINTYLAQRSQRKKKVPKPKNRQERMRQ